MAAGNAVEGKARRRAIGPHDLNKGQLGGVIGRGVCLLHTQQLRLRGQRVHVGAQLGRDVTAVNVQAQHQRVLHAGEDRLELGRHRVVDGRAGRRGGCGDGRRRGPLGHVTRPAGRLLGHDASALAGSLEVTLHLGCRGRALPHGGGNLAQALLTHVTRGKEALDARHLAIVRDHVALRVKLGHARHQRGCRRVAHKDKDAHRTAVCRGELVLLARGAVKPADAPHHGVALHGKKLRVCPHGDLLVGIGRVGRGLCAGEVIRVDQDGHVRGVRSEKHRLLRRSKAAAHHEDLAAGEELAVAGGAVRHAVAAEVFLARKAGASRRGACGKKDRQAADVTARGVHHLDVCRKVERLHACQQHLGAKGLRLAAHGIRELLAACGEHARVVHDLGGDGDLATKVLALDHQHTVTRAGQVKRGREPGRAAANHHRVVYVVAIVLAHVPNLPRRARRIMDGARRASTAGSGIYGCALFARCA